MTTTPAVPRDHPILFSGPMVRAILEGRKTQTRRVVNPDPGSNINPVFLEDGQWQWETVESRRRCPYGQPGERLWVRETFWNSRGDDSMPTLYKADQDDLLPADQDYHQGPWKPSIHMPRWASRLTLNITEIRVERINDISVVDSRAEGIPAAPAGSSENIDLFAELWDSINANRGFGWESNPWVWAVTFEPAT